MPATIISRDTDTAEKVQDEVRNLPANQGKNDHAMWLLIHAEIATSIAANKLVRNTTYIPANKHGAK
ncbi:hypothetical protein H0W80_00220 [Candidatus Saccharibacteria bacterium]|nr:hypothetical protein [Candidatus Saccharibacteria bacterium]